MTLLPKKAGNKCVTNLRPIALQCALAKMPSGILAERMATAFHEHRALSPATHAFVKGRSATGCAAMFADVCEFARTRGRSVFGAIVDIRKCYDRIPHWVVRLALQRLLVPDHVVNYVLRSLQSSRVRFTTAWGATDWLPVRCGLKQGDPLSPLLCNTVFDMLHAGLALNPLSGVEEGFVLPSTISPASGARAIRDTSIGSEGYADDFFVVSGSADGLCRQLLFMLRFVIWIGEEIAWDKLAWFGLLPDGSSIADDVVLEIQLPDNSLMEIAVTPAHKAVRYLGFHASPSGDWSTEFAHLSSVTGMLVHEAVSSGLRLDQCVQFLNRMLIPILEFHFHLVPATPRLLEQLDKCIARQLSAKCGALRGWGTFALAAGCGLILPSSRFVEVAATEMLVRLNDPEDIAAAHAYHQFQVVASGRRWPSSKSSRLAVIDFSHAGALWRVVSLPAGRWTGARL